MNCRQAQDRLLLADDPRSADSGSAELTEHLQSCAVCATLAARVHRLEQAWRAMPMLDGAEQSRQLFLQRMPKRPRKVHPRQQPRHPYRVFLPWAVAATVLLAIGLTTWIVAHNASRHRTSPQLAERAGASSPQAPSTHELVVRLMDWNLEIAQAASLDERQRIYSENALALKLALEAPGLTDEDRELAEQLVENGSWLTSSEDPMAEAERFNDMADTLVQRMDSAAGDGDFSKVDRYSSLYSRVAEKGVAASLKKVEAAPLDVKRQQRVAAVVQRNDKHLEALGSLAGANHVPPPTKKNIQQAVETSKKHTKPHRQKDQKSGGK